jgi:hypothetical protein
VITPPPKVRKRNNKYMKKFLNKLRIYCLACDKFKLVRKGHMGTQYVEEASNYCIECPACYEETLEYWRQQWEEYYSSVM